MMIRAAMLCFVTMTTLACASEGDVVWPISKSAELDADVVSSPFGPRDQSGDYDFHAGIDFPVPEGTKVHAIKAGTVEKVEEHDGGTGPGNWVLIDHGDGEKSAYLHLSKTSVKVGESVQPGTKLGRSGSTGASSPHLHFNYMVGVDHPGADEAVAHNPLELLPHAPMPTPTASFTNQAVILDVAIHPMTIQTLTVEGEGQSRTVDYTDVLALGNPERDDPIQSGLRLAVGETEAGQFTLTLTPVPPFRPTRVVALDYAGDVVLDASAD